MEGEFKLDSHLLTALQRGERGLLFDVIIGFDRNRGEGPIVAVLDSAGLARVGPRTAKGVLTRDQLFRVAEQPVVTYLKLVERFQSAWP